MSDSFKTKKLIQQQINSGALNSFFNKGQVNTLNVGRSGQNSLNVIGNENVDGLFVADKIGINTSNPTKPLEVNSSTIFEGKISVSASSVSPPYTATVTGTNTKFKKLFNQYDLIIFPNSNNIEIYGIINAVVVSDTTLNITLANQLTSAITNVNYQGFYYNQGTISINSDPLNLKKVLGTNTLFKSFFKNGDKFITINNSILEIQNVNNIVSDTELYTSGTFSNTTPTSGLNNYCAVLYDIIDDYGNMGLGTYNPSQKLDVDGNINVSGHIYNNGVLVEVSPWLNSIVPATPPYTQNIYYDLGYVGIGNVSSNPAYLLDVYGSARFQDTIINSTTDSSSVGTGSLTTTGGVGITKNLNVGGTFTVAGLTSANGGITVPTAKSVLINGTSTLTVGSGATTLGGVLAVTGLTSANGGITVPTAQSVLINGTSTLTIGTGATTLGGTLTVTGLTSANGGITVPTGQTVTLNGTTSLTVGGALTVTGLTSANGGITVPTAQSVLINGTSTLTVGTGATTLGGVLIVTGLTSTNGGITVPTAQSVLINGTSTLTVGTGATTLGGTLTVTGLTSTNGGITVPTAQSVLINGTSTLTVGTGATILGGSLTVTGLTSTNGGITVPTGQSVLINGNSILTVGTGATTLGGSLTVTGLTSTNGGLTVPSGQAVQINGNSTLTVGTGATTLGGALTVTGLTSANGGITVPTSMAVAINGNSTLTVGTGATTLGGALTVAGLTSANGGITVPTSMAVAINGTSTLTVGTGTTTLGGALTVAGLTSANGGITVPTSMAVAINGTSTLTVGTGITTLGGALTVTGLTLANGGITVPTSMAVAIDGTSTLTVGTGTTTLGGLLNVTTFLTTLSNGLTVSGTNGVSLNSTTNTINIGDGANNNNINIGTAGVRTLTVGNNTAGTKLNITAGTSNATDGVIVTGNTYLNNKYINYVDITTLADADYTPTGINFVNGYYFQSVALSVARNFTTPTAANIVAAIKNCIVGSCFNFTISNKGGINNRVIVGGTSVDVTNLISTTIATNKVATFICRITNVGSGTETAVLYDTVV